MKRGVVKKRCWFVLRHVGTEDPLIEESSWECWQYIRSDV